MEKMEKMILKVPTIKCEGCIENIGRALKQREGIERVEGNPETKQVTVSYLSEKIREEQIRSAIVEIGHQVG